MQRTRVYLDHNATTPLHPAAREAMCAAFERCGNASSVHAEGRAARALIETARGEIGSFVGVAAENVVFTSGGTEALNLVLTPHIGAPGQETRAFNRLFAAAGEHAAVLSGHRFPPAQLELVGLTPHGTLDIEALDFALARALAASQHVMLAVQAANNETGVLQPVPAAAEKIHAAGGYVVCDAVQLAGKSDCRFQSLGADAIVLSAHKFGGPQGVGAVCFVSDSTHIRDVLLRGGGQERGLRGGTENVAGIAGMAAALRAAKARVKEQAAELAAWRNGLEAEISRIAAGAVFFGAGTARLPNTSCFALPGIEAHLLLMSLDMEGIAVSSGSACSSGKVKRSHVLTAMGVEPDLARGAIRVSLGWDSQPEDCASFVKALERTVGTIKARRNQSAA